MDAHVWLFICKLFRIKCMNLKMILMLPICFYSVNNYVTRLCVCYFRLQMFILRTEVQNIMINCHRHKFLILLFKTLQTVAREDQVCGTENSEPRWSPNAVRPNAIRAGSAGTRTRLGVQVDSSNFQICLLARWTRTIRIRGNGERGAANYLNSLHAAASLITTVSL